MARKFGFLETFLLAASEFPKLSQKDFLTWFAKETACGFTSDLFGELLLLLAVLKTVIADEDGPANEINSLFPHKFINISN